MVSNKLKYKPDLTLLLVLFITSLEILFSISFFPLSRDIRNSGIWHTLKIQEMPVKNKR